MSCWMVENRSINQIVAFLQYTDAYGAPHQWRESLKRAHDRYQCGPYDPEMGRRDRWAELGYEMHMMNRAAVLHRYTDGESMMGESYVYRDERPPSPYEAHKLLSCFLYQCSEGNVPELELFKMLDNTKDSIAYGIVQALPEWQAADCWR